MTETSIEPHCFDEMVAGYNLFFLASAETNRLRQASKVIAHSFNSENAKKSVGV